MTKLEIQDKFFEYRHSYMALYREGKIEEVFNKIKEFWDYLPEPKMVQDMSYLLLVDFFDFCIDTKKFELANKWISLMFIADLERLDDGERNYSWKISL